FKTTPTNALPNPCGGVLNTACVDVNDHGVTDVNVTILVLCSAIEPILNSALNLALTADQNCTAQANQLGPGVAGVASNNSSCANSVWDTQATAVDVVTNAQYVINQGVSVRGSSGDLCP